MLSALRVDAPGDKGGLLVALATQRLEDGVREQVLDRDLRQVTGDEGLVVAPQTPPGVDLGLGYVRCSILASPAPRSRVTWTMVPQIVR